MMATRPMGPVPQHPRVPATIERRRRTRSRAAFARDRPDFAAVPSARGARRSQAASRGSAPTPPSPHAQERALQSSPARRTGDRPCVAQTCAPSEAVSSAATPRFVDVIVRAPLARRCSAWTMSAGDAATSGVAPARTGAHRTSNLPPPERWRKRCTRDRSLPSAPARATTRDYSDRSASTGAMRVTRRAGR